MNNKRTFLLVFPPAIIGTLIFAAFLISSRSSARAADVSTLVLPPRPVAQSVTGITPDAIAIVTPTPSLTETVIGRLSVLLAKPILTSASNPLPPGTSLAEVNLVTDVVTVVLNLPESVLYNASVAVGSDSINMAVVQSLQDLPLHVFHVLTNDPRDPQGGPKSISSFIHLRPVTNKPYERVPVTPTLPGVAQSQAATATTFALSGKSVYLSAGHGWYYNPSSSWSTQRPPYQAIVEDMNNAEAVNQYLAAYLRQAGADVFPAREPSLNTSEVVIANTSTGYAETGVWVASSTSGTGYKGSTYRFAVTTNSGMATASATWTANIPTSGWYPVYAWYLAGTNRASDAHYEIEYPLGTHVALIDQTKHGSTWRYLGTFYFRAGEVARVRLLNTSSTSGAAVIADAVRFGGGIGDYNSGGGVSGKPRWEEASRYWTYFMGAPASVFDSYPGSTTCDYTAPDLCDDITARPRYADWENVGSGDDAVLLSWHTNGYDGTARGTVSYVYDNSDPSYTRVAGSVELQSLVHDQVLSAIHSGWDPSWIDRGKQQMNLGEVRVAQSMPSMLIEMGFHDNTYDAASLKDPRFNQLLARATYQGIVKYYAQKAGVTPHYMPEPPERFTMRNAGNGAIALSWKAPATTAMGTATDPASSYRVYLSNDGFAWDEGREVADTSLVLSGYSTNQLVYARITAINAGGESFPTPVLAARVGNIPRVLIVQGFDSIDSSMDLVQNVGSYPGVARIIVDRMNRQNYIVQHAVAITEAFDSAVHQAIGASDLSPSTYQFVDWYAGRQSVGDVAINAAERTALNTFVTGAKRVLFISGANVAAQLSGSVEPTFLTNVLHSGFVQDDAGSYTVNATAGGFFAGIGGFNLDDGAHGTYNAQSNDVIATSSGSNVGLTYGTGTTAATVFLGTSSATIINLGFPFETVYPAGSQAQLMSRALNLLGAPLTISTNSPVQVGNSAVLTASLTGNYSYAWNFGDGSAVLNSPSVPVTHLFPAAGQYTVLLTATNTSDSSVVTARAVMVISGLITPRAYLPLVNMPGSQVVEARAVWISRFDWCSPAPCSRTKLETLINHAADAHFNVVLLQVRATGDAYYTPGLEPWSYLLTSGLTSTLGTDPGWDPLAVAVQVAHSRGLQLHAYVNMYSNWECGKWYPPHTTPEHPFWTLGDFPNTYSSTWRVYSTTTSGPTAMSVLTSASVPCNEYLWSSPGVNRVNQENLNVVKDIVTRYDVDGVHMDRVRYPGSQYSTDPETLAAWQPVSKTISFQDWERNILSNWVMRVYTEVKAIKPSVKLSAAVWFTYKKTTAITFATSQGYSDYFQDSHRWITEGSLDAIAPMIYGTTFNNNLTYWQQLADDHVAVQGARQVWLGIGGAITPFSGITDRIAYARQIGARGVALWSAGALETNNYWGALAAGPFKDVAIAP
jgi:uncharacterized lipoprotein YddW (UPF0748 family)/N-acetylmuramoyl-L-alanine amidase